MIITIIMLIIIAIVIGGDLALLGVEHLAELIAQAGGAAAFFRGPGFCCQELLSLRKKIGRVVVVPRRGIRKGVFVEDLHF